MIWPEKPITGELGAELYFAARGYEGSSISPGLFAESYWNLGWIGIPVLFVPLGILLALMSSYAMNSVRSAAWIRLPVLLYGIKIGTRVDGHYVLDVIGAAAIIAALIIIVNIMEKALSDRRLRSRPASLGA